MEANEAAQELWVKKKKCFTVACGTQSGTSSLTPHCPVSVNRTQHSWFCFVLFFPWHCLSEWCQGSCTRLWLFNLQLWQRVKRSPRWAEGEDKVLLKLRTWLIVKPNFRGSRGPVERERSLERHSAPPSSGTENLPAVWKSRVEVTGVKMQHNKVTWQHDLGRFFSRWTSKTHILTRRFTAQSDSVAHQNGTQCFHSLCLTSNVATVRTEWTWIILFYCFVFFV